MNLLRRFNGFLDVRVPITGMKEGDEPLTGSEIYWFEMYPNTGNRDLYERMRPTPAKDVSYTGVRE
jgi:hypothetical protein